jgi:thiol-disulfide isomerase/thioredoxin
MKQVEAIFVITLIALIAIVVYFGMGIGDGGVRGNAPNFTLTDTDGNTFSLSDFGDKVVVLDLMATWCGPCIQEIPHLKEVQQHYGDNVIILSVGVGGDSNQELKNFKDEQGATWRFAIDTDDVATKYEVVYIPKLVIIDKNENIKFTHEGVTSSATLIEEIDGLL